MSGPCSLWHSIFILSIAVTNAVYGDVPPTSLSLSEQWVLERVTAGQEADLSVDDVINPSIRGRFLTQLIQEAVDGTHNTADGFRITHASVEGDFVIPSQNAITFPIAFEHCEFLGKVDARSLICEREVSFEKSVFREVDFTNASFTEFANFNRCTFFENVHFEGAGARNFLFVDAQFPNPNANAYFNRIHTLEHAYFDDVDVACWFWLDDAVIKGDLRIQDATFTGKEAGLQGDGNLKAGSLRLSRSVFDAGAIFRGAKFGSVYADDVTFRLPACFDSDEDGKCDNPLFSCKGMEVSGDFVLTNSHLDGGMSLDDSVIDGDFVMRDVSFGPPPHGIDGFVRLSVEVGGNACLKNVSFNVKKVTLADSTFGTLSWTGVKWPEGSVQVDLSRVKLNSLRNMRPESGHNWWSPLLELAGRAVFERPFYMELESGLRGLGESQAAEQVFLVAKQRERDEVLTGWRLTGSWAERFVWNYGTNPFPSMLCLLFLWLFGWLVVFWRTPRPCDEIPVGMRYNAALFSLQRLSWKTFGQVKYWKPRGYLRQFYVWLHAGLGAAAGLVAFAALANKLGVPLRPWG